jgi:hypothetical protein
MTNLHKLSNLIISLTMGDARQYGIIETNFTIHYIEKIMASAKDRGSFKWFAETKWKPYQEAVLEDNPEAFKSHIDGADMFPRVYFLSETLISEMGIWFEIRNLQITKHRIDHA